MSSLIDFRFDNMVAHLISLTLIGAVLYYYLTTKEKRVKSALKAFVKLYSVFQAIYCLNADE